MSGKEAADLFRTPKAGKLDRATAAVIAHEIGQLDREADVALSHELSQPVAVRHRPKTPRGR